MTTLNQIKTTTRSIGIYVCANAIGLLVAAVYLGPGFRLGFLAFFIAVVVFTAVEATAKPLLARITEKRVPLLAGSVSLIAVFVSLVMTNLVVPNKVISGIGNWLAATLIVWLFSLIAQFVLAKFVFPAAKPRSDATGGDDAL